MNTDSTDQSPGTGFRALPGDLNAILLNWYDKKRRILPWREDPTPYHVWISEIMLQQTRVEAVIPYYLLFLETLPDIASLAEVPEDILLKLWEGLGYYSRVRNLKKAAIQVMQDYGGALPSDPKKLAKLSGIGPYTAAAIASIAFQVPVPSVDGNLLRVYARLTGYEEDIKAPAAKKTAEEAFLRVLPADRPGDMNQALMDLGATVCLPNGFPICDQCPVSSLCHAHQTGKETELPKTEKKAARPVEKRTVLLIRFGSSCLIRRRPDSGLLAGLWEFPNVTGHLTAEEILNRFQGSESIRPLPPARHIFTHLVWDMIGYEIILPEEAVLSEESVPMFVPVKTLLESYAIPSAFSAYTNYLKRSIF